MDITSLIPQKIELEDIICRCLDVSDEKLKELIRQFDSKWIQAMILHAAYSNFFNYKILGDLFELTGSCRAKLFSSSLFCQYLLVRGLIKKEDFHETGPPLEKFLKQVEEYENPLKDDTIWACILEDDVKKFVEFITVNNVNIKNERIFINGHRYFILSFACYCSSVNIFKYLFLNQTDVDTWTIHNAVGGGSEEIIQTLESQGHSFNNTLRTAIGAHHNKIAKWLFENYKDIFFVFPDCVQMFNTEMLLFFLYEANINININEKGVWGKTALHYAAELNDAIDLKILLSKKADKEVKDDYDKTPYQYAESSEIKSIIMLSA